MSNFSNQLAPMDSSIEGGAAPCAAEGVKPAVEIDDFALCDTTV